jgi:hypothetical protein
MSGAPAAMVPPRPALGFLRERRRAHQPASRRSDRFTAAYTAALYAVVGVLLGVRVLRQSPARGAAAAWLSGGGIARVAVAALLLGLLASLRYATWQGPVVFSAPDVQFLLSAPLPRAELVRGRLRRGLALAGGLGALLGLEAELGVAAGPLLAACVLGPAAFGVLCAALGWLVERSAARARLVLLAGPLLLVLAAAAAFGGSVAASVAPWSGPWGWAAGPMVAAAKGHDPGWPPQAALLVALTVAVLLAAWRGAGAITLEELGRRAGTRSGLSADLYVADLRGAALLRREATRGLFGSRRVRLRRPPAGRRWRWLVVAWRDSLSGLRAPGRFGWALLLGGTGVLTVAVAPDRRVVIAAAVLACYLAAAQLVEPLRAEADQPDASRQLPWRWSQLLLLHLPLPTLALSVVGWAALLLALALGLLPAAGLGVALAGCPFVAATLVCCAAVPAQRGRLEADRMMTAMTMGELGGPTYLFRWFATGPLLAAICLIVPIVIMEGAPHHPGRLAALAVNAFVPLLLALGCLLGWLRSRRPPGS